MENIFLKMRLESVPMIGDFFLQMEYMRLSDGMMVFFMI